MSRRVVPLFLLTRKNILKVGTGRVTFQHLNSAGSPWFFFLISSLPQKGRRGAKMLQVNSKSHQLGQGRKSTPPPQRKRRGSKRGSRKACSRTPRFLTPQVLQRVTPGLPAPTAGVSSLPQGGIKPAGTWVTAGDWHPVRCGAAARESACPGQERLASPGQVGGPGGAQSPPGGGRHGRALPPHPR